MTYRRVVPLDAGYEIMGFADLTVEAAIGHARDNPDFGVEPAPP